MINGAEALRLQLDAADRPAGAGHVGLPDRLHATTCPTLAQSSIGQNDVQATPLQMALVAAGVANDGKIMTPHVMTEVRDSDGARRQALRRRAVAAADQPRRTPRSCRAACSTWSPDGTATRPADPRLRGRRQDRHRPARHRPAGARTPGSSASPARPATRRSPSPSWCSNQPGRQRGRPAAGSPPRSPSRSWPPTWPTSPPAVPPPAAERSTGPTSGRPPIVTDGSATRPGPGRAPH